MTVAGLRLLVLLFLLQLTSLCNFSFSLSENEALLKLKESFTNADALNDWVSGSDPCKRKWVGVICFGGGIEGLHLSDLGLSGSIDIEALQELKGLRTVSLVNNSFSDPIPEFNKLGVLKSLLLSYNKFSGEIANDYFTPMSSLKKIWLSGNNFTGKIPDSVMQLSHLMELHLEKNQFSGPIPPLKESSSMLTSFDFSNNLLSGEIPSSYSSFNASAFSGNDQLCGKPLDRLCSSGSSPSVDPKAGAETDVASASSSPSASSTSNDGNSKTIVVVMLIALVAVFVALSIYSANAKNYDDDFKTLERENLDEVVLPVRSQGSTNKSTSLHSNNSTRGGGGSSRKGSTHHSKHGSGDLIMINEDRGSFGLQDLMKAAAEVLGSGGLGSAYKAVMSNGLSVVVKRMREMKTLARDSFDAEMKRFGRIRHKNILTPLAYHFRKEEKLLVSEYKPKGSLLYVLHGDRGICHAELNWPTRLKIIKGIAHGLNFLHSEYSTYNLPHGNLKSSNVLISETYEPLLGDYAMDPLTNPTYAAQSMFAYKSPEYIQNNEVSPKSDVYCLGIIILEVITGKFPSQYLANGKGGTDVVQWVIQAISEGREEELIDPDISDKTNTDSIQKMVQLLRIGAACTESNTTQRLKMSDAIRKIEEIQV